MNIEQWPIGRPGGPKPYARNARVIPDKAVQKVAESIKQFGWRQPMVVDPAGEIIIGHVRLKAAVLLGLTEVPVHVGDNLSAARVKALRLADNRTHDEATWDLELLKPELLELQGLDYDLSGTGFDARELGRLMLTTVEGAVFCHSRKRRIGAPSGEGDSNPWRRGDGKHVSKLR